MLLLKRGCLKERTRLIGCGAHNRALACGTIRFETSGGLIEIWLGELMTTGHLALAQYCSLQATVYIIPAPVSPRHLDTLFGGKVGLAMFPVGVVEERSVGPVEIVKIHLAAAEPNLGAIFDIDAGEEL